MTTLREAAQQALEAMESAEVDPHSSDAVYKAITALKAALAEYDKDRVKVEEMKANWALQRKLAEETQERDRQQREYEEQRLAALGCDEDTGECACAPPATPNCPNCASLEAQNNELDRKLAEMEAKLNNPSVDDAFRILAEANRRAIDYINELERQINELKRAAPPQRKPLTEEEIKQLLFESAGMTVTFSAVDLSLARAIERAHGIGGDE